MKLAIPTVIVAAALQACSGEMQQVSAVSTTSANIASDQSANESHPFVHVVPWPTFGRGVERDIKIQLGPDALARCRNVSPKFAFDRAQTFVDSDDELEALASCLNHPSMQDQTILLVGRADPRGTVAYNDRLALERAENIEDYLVRHGVDAGRIELSSEGKSQATTEARPDFSYGYDRRVDVIVRGVHAPL
jgi:outer membrane protein OmpA-like peptidoglycan-associated protein